MPDDLYHHDILAWSKAQADRLRRLAAGEQVNDLDWEHVIEEVEDVGRSELKATTSHLRQALIHLLKLLGWPAHPAAMHWSNEVVALLGNARHHFEPGMRQNLDLPTIYGRALREVRALRMETGPPVALPEAMHLTVDDLLAEDRTTDDLLARFRTAPPPGA